jgi:HK97 family phage prohead protease
MSKKEKAYERRVLHEIPDQGSAIRAETDKDGNRYFVGYPVVYNSRSKLIWDWDRYFYELVLPGAFDTILSRDALDVPLVTNHDRYEVLARTISGNLEVKSDDTGLWFRSLVPNTTLGNDTWEMVNRGDFTDMSFRFQVEESGRRWYKDEEGNLIHEIREVLELLDISILAVHGAYNETVIDTEVASRMYDELIREDDGSDGGDGGSNPDNPDDGNPNPTPEEIAETEKATAADLDHAEMDVEILEAKYGIEPTESET